MEDALVFAAAAPLIVAAIALVRQIVPELRGRAIPPLVLALTVAWGIVLVATGRFEGDAAEFVVGVVAVASAAIALSGVVSTYAAEGSTAERLT